MNFHFTHKNLTSSAAANLNECSHEYSLSHSYVAQKRHAAQKLRVAPNRFARRRGQALLISVLLMVFAAVLGATFVTVVALNLSQTARSGSVASAKQAALAGKTFVNEQLTNSEKGERWLPIDAQSGVTAGDTYYFSDFERAQGWDQPDANGNQYVKFPDPRSTTASAAGAPIYLTKVTPVVAPLLTDPEHDFDGQLRVNIIGRASDNDAVSSRLVFYKPTSQNGNFTTFARYISNWNFGKSRDENIKFLTSPNTAPTSTLIGGLLDADFDAEGDPLTTEFTDPPQQSLKGGALVHGNIDLVGKSRFILPTNSDKFALTGIATTNATSFVSDTTASAGEAFPTTATANPSSLQQRVLIGANNADPTSRRGTVRTITPARLDAPNSRWRQLSQYFDVAGGSQYGFSDGGGVYIDNNEDIETAVYNDANPKYNPADPPGSPNLNPVITKYRTLSIYETQRVLARKSFAQPNTTYTNPQTNVSGIYRANGNVNTSVVNATGGYDSSPGTATTRFQRNYWPRAGVDNYGYGGGGSLEEDALRGWVTAREFLPRGVLVELKGDTVVITRDDISDTQRYFPNSNKSWKDTNGNVLIDASGNPMTRAYRMEVNVLTGVRRVGAAEDTGAYSYTYTPSSSSFNGVIFAEGNVRVRGYTNTKNITIVSMGSIYIEGGINRTLIASAANDPLGRVALLAKRNVVMNPTRIVTPIEGVRSAKVPVSFLLADVPAAGTYNTLSTRNIDEVKKLRVGDKFRIGNDNQWRTVLSMTEDTPLVAPTIPGSVTFTPAYTLAGAGPFTNLQGNVMYDRVGVANDTQSLTRTDSTNTIARDVNLDGATPVGSYWFALEHRGENVMGLNFNRQVGTTGNGTVEVTSSNTPIPTKTLALTPSTPASFDLRNIAAPPLPGTAASNTLGALVWQFYKDNGDNGATANSGDREIVSIDPDGAGPLPAALAYGEPDANTDWDLYVPPTNLSVLTRRLANSPAVSPPNIPPLGATDTPLDKSAGTGSVPLTVSVGLYNTNTALNFVGVPVATIGSTFGVTGNELSETVDQTFYTGGLIKSTIAFDDNSVTPRVSATNSNIAAFRRLLTGDGDILPAYVLGSMKLDRQTLADVAAAPIEITVDATVYAQQGSWFVIPQPMLQPAGTDPDLRRLRRLNYQLQIRGSIGERITPTAVTDYYKLSADNPSDYAPAASVDSEQDPDNRISGAQSAWLDAAARPTTASGSNWESVRYLPSAYVQSTDNSNLLYLPITPDISYQR